MALRARVPALLFLFLLSSTMSSSQARVGRDDGQLQMLLPSSGFSGGLITGVVLGPDDQPVANAPVTITGGYPATLSGEVIGDEPPKEEAAKFSHNSGSLLNRPQLTGAVIEPLQTPQDCTRLLRQAQELLVRNPGNEPIPIGMLVPAVQKIRESASKPSATSGGADDQNFATPSSSAGDGGGSRKSGSIVAYDQADAAGKSTAIPSEIVALNYSKIDAKASHGNEKWIRGNSGGLYTDAEGRFAFCATNDSEQAHVRLSEIVVTKLNDRSVQTSIPLRKAGDPAACDPQPPSYFSPDSKLDLCRSATRGLIIQGGREWKLASARAFSPNGDRVLTTFKTPRDLGPGRAQLSFLDEQGRKQSFTGGVFQIVNASIDRNRLHSHQGAEFQFEIAFNFQPAGGSQQNLSDLDFAIDWSGPGLCVNVATAGPIVLTQPPPSKLQVNGDGRATVKGKIRATQVAPGSAVPFGITLRVNQCPASAAAGSNPLFLASGDVNDSNPLYARLHGGLQPSVRQWVTEQARLQAQKPDRAALERVMRPRFGLVGGSDIEALVFLVMMQAAQDAHEDLKALAEKMQALNQKKQELRGRQSLLEQERANRGNGSAAQPCVTPGCTDLARSLGLTRAPTYAELDAAHDQLKTQLDSVADGEDDLNLRLQKAQEHRSQMMNMISNIMKKMSDTSQAIVSNLK